MFSETRSSWDLLLSAQGAMTLVRGWLLFLAFNINLAQENLEEVPVQPDFDSRKVSVMARPRLSAWMRTGHSITLRVC